MASQSLVAFLAEAGAKVESRSNGEAEVALQIAGDSALSDERASADTSVACTTLNDNATAPPDTPLSLDAHIHAAKTASNSPDATHSLDAHIHAAHAAPPEEAQKGEFATESMDAVESIEHSSSPADNAMLSTMPSTAAVITGCIDADDTPSMAAVAARDASEAIVKPSTEILITVVPTLPSTEAVIADTITLDSNAATSMPSAEAVLADTITLDSNAASSIPSVEAVVADSTPITDPIAVATTDSAVVSVTDTTAPVVADSGAPLITDSTIVEPISPSPTSLEGLSSGFSKPEMDAPLEELDQTASKAEEEEELPPELDSIQVPAHWHPKPCVHISSIGGALTEEELLPVFSKFGPIASVSFENDRHDAVLIRYDLHLENGEDLLTQVREATNSTKLGDKTLIVEPFRPDSLLFVGNLTPNIDDAALQTMFEPHGNIERAFVLKNANEQSKCYGFVEYSLKSQAMGAKAVMGNINMDGRVLRVEWSDCKKVEEMLSTVLFIDRIPREGAQVEGVLKNLFGKYGKIRDSHLAIGTGNQIRGFAFIDFYHSASADKAHLALDGHMLEGSSIRVSFANPSKSAQSYRFRYGAQAGQGPNVRGGAGTVLGPPPRGMTRGPSPRVPSPMGLLPSRFMNPARPGMIGFGIGMQFGRGSYDRGPGSSFHGSGRGMLGPSSFGAGRASLMMGNMPPRAGMAVVENNMQKLPFGQGPVTITPSAIVQVATAQARAREEEAKARAEAAKHGGSRSFSSNDSLPMNHYQRLQQFQHQNYLQQQQASSYEQQYKQGDMYMHQQAHQASLQPQQQAWNQVPQPHSQQTMQLQRTPYHANASQNFPQQHQGAQNDGYYQQAAQHPQQHGYAAQYGQQHGYQYGQQAAQMYGQGAQQTNEQYQQSAQQAQAAYSQQNYGDQYAAHQQASQQGYYPSTSFDGSAGMDAAQQQAYSAYYHQQAQAQAQAQAQGQTQAAANPEAATAAATQQSYEAQWAAYYASQAAYQQQASATEVGQKRSADQMDSSAQSQAAYNYAGYPQQAAGAYQQQQQQATAQPSNENVAAYQAQANPSAAYQQQAAYAAYQQQGYQQAAAPAGYSQTGYEQASAATADGAYQQQAAAYQAQAAAYDYSKKPRF